MSEDTSSWLDRWLMENRDPWHRDLENNGPCSDHTCDICGNHFMGDDW